MKNDKFLKEAKRLYDMGFAVHWIKPGSKAPVKSGWSGTVRDSWDDVESSYKSGYGLGVRLGEASKLPHGYLCNIDIDIKSKEKRHREEAKAFLEKKFPHLLGQPPMVKTGYGYRIFGVTAEPLKSGKLTSSVEQSIVLMPTAEINRRQRQAVEEGLLTEKELSEGYRVRPSWEIDFMSVGKQVVLPPTIHPDLKTPYTWVRAVLTPDDLPLLTLDGKEYRKASGRPEGQPYHSFRPVAVDLSRAGDKVRDLIISGTGVTDRSSAMYGATISLVRAGFSEEEILTILTERSYVLGEVAYDHRKTDSRSAAADWVKRYCYDKAFERISAERAFSEEVEVSPVLQSEAEVENQLKELGAVPDKTSWELWLERSGRHGDGPPKPTLKNLVLILQNAIATDVFKYNEFSSREHYGALVPWNEKAGPGTPIEDSDALQMRLWLAQRYSFEPPAPLIHEAITVISRQNAYHPVRKWLSELPEWDGKERLDSWLLRYFGGRSDHRILSEVFRKWVVAGITRVYEPGAQFDWVPILEGQQGTGKSSFGAILFGRDYFLDWLPNLADKDAALALHGNWCIEFGELANMHRNQLEAVKAFITRREDKVRPPYGRRSIEAKRQCVFFGTTNEGEYLIDTTGNRRFAPLEVGQLNFKALERDRKQLWAEALFIYRNGLEESLDLSPEVQKLYEVIHRRKTIATDIDVMEGYLLDAMDNPEIKIDWIKGFKIKDLFSGFGPFSTAFKENGRNYRNAAAALRNLLFKQEHRELGNFWFKPAENAEKLNPLNPNEPIKDGHGFRGYH